MPLLFSNGFAYQQNSDKAANYPSTVLIHGAGSSHLGWPFAIRHLPTQNILAIDLPNHGSSAPKELHSIEEYAQDIYSFLKALQLKKVNLIGYSMGSAMVLQLLLTYPFFCEKAVLMAYAPGVSLPASNFQTLSEEDCLESFSKKLFFPNFPEALQSKLLESSFGKDKTILKKDLLLTSQYRPTFPREKCTVPTLFIFGKDDPFIDPEQKSILTEHFSNATIHEINHAGHLFIWQETTLVKGQLLQFLVP